MEAKPCVGVCAMRSTCNHKDDFYENCASLACYLISLCHTDINWILNAGVTMSATTNSSSV
jgi:hypothetical protein